MPQAHIVFLVIQSYSFIKYSFTIEKKYFRKNIKTNHENLGLSFSAREKFSNDFKSRLFPIKKLDKISTHEPTPELAPEPTKHKKSRLKLQKKQKLMK